VLGHGPKQSWEASSVRKGLGQQGSKAFQGYREGDLIIGKGHKSVIGTIVEHTNRFVIMVPLPEGQGAFPIREAFAKTLLDMPAHMRKTLAYDLGKAMAGQNCSSRKLICGCASAIPPGHGSAAPARKPTCLSRMTFPRAVTSHRLPPKG
jgi:hypothetical protein